MKLLLSVMVSITSVDNCWIYGVYIEVFGWGYQPANS